MPSVNSGPAVVNTTNTTSDLSVMGQVSPTFTSANLPAANSVPAGTVVWTTDLGAFTSNGVAWIGSAFQNSAGAARVLAQGAVPVILPPSGFFANNGVYVLGQAPNSSATVSFSATSGAGVTMTFSAGTNLLGTASDIGRVLTILDTTYKYATVTAQSSATVATVTLTGTLSGTGPFANNTIWMSGTTAAITGTAGFSSLLSAVNGNCWMSFPAGSIAAGVPAAQTVYFAQMATSTLVTVFNNILTAGAIPNAASIPASPTAFATTGPGAFNQVTSAQTVVTVPVPGNTLGANGRLALGYGLSNNNSAGTKSLLPAFGALSFPTLSNTTNLSQSQLRDMFNSTGTGAQVSYPGTGWGAASPGAPSVGSVDTTAAVNVTLKLQVATAATDYAEMDFFEVLAYPG